MSDSAQTYDEHRAQLAEEQGGMSREEIVRRMARDSEGMVDLNNLPGQDHHWVDRGIVKSCEGAGHPNHRYYVRT